MNRASREDTNRILCLRISRSCLIFPRVTRAYRACVLTKCIVAATTNLAEDFSRRRNEILRSRGESAIGRDAILRRDKFHGKKSLRFATRMHPASCIRNRWNPKSISHDELVYCPLIYYRSHVLFIVLKRCVSSVLRIFTWRPGEELGRASNINAKGYGYTPFSRISNRCVRVRREV